MYNMTSVHVNTAYFRINAQGLFELKCGLYLTWNYNSVNNWALYKGGVAVMPDSVL
jgi:hypothetical protein